MATQDVLSGYLDVKVSLRQRRRGFTPWKVWRKQWCELRHVGGSQHVVEFRVNSTRNGPSPSNFIIPRNAVLCRTESRSKRFAFGIFSHGNIRKPIFFLSGSSETDTQKWIEQFRRMLTPAKYLPLREGTFTVSLIDNQHSRLAALFGLYGTLSTGPHGVCISDPTNGHPRLILPWQHLLQFHLAATGVSTDDKKICILHTSSEFSAGAGQIHLFCQNAPQLLQKLNNRGRVQRLFISSSLTTSNRRLSRSEGDLRQSFTTDTESLRDSGLSSCSPADNVTPVNLRSNHGSQDSGVRISMASDDSGLVLKSKTASALITTGLGLLGCAPNMIGGCDDSFDEVFSQDILMPLFPNINKKAIANRRESGVSIASGIYEEISEDVPPASTESNTNSSTKQSAFSQSQQSKTPNHYEDPVDIILKRACTPPPLPPRKFQDRLRLDSYSEDNLDDLPLAPSSFTSLRYPPAISLQFLPRCHTMPSKSTGSTTTSCSSSYHFSSSSSQNGDENDYLPMSPGLHTKTFLTESLYLPMSPIQKTFVPDTDSLYMDMNGARNGPTTATKNSGITAIKCDN